MGIKYSVTGAKDGYIYIHDSVDNTNEPVSVEQFKILVFSKKIDIQGVFIDPNYNENCMCAIITVPRQAKQIIINDYDNLLGVDDIFKYNRSRVLRDFS